MRKIISEFTFDDMKLVYHTGINRKGKECTGMVLIPANLESQVVEQKEYDVEPLIQVKLIGDDYPFNYSQGRTMRNSESSTRMKFADQKTTQEGCKTVIETCLKDDRGLVYKHFAAYTKGDKALVISCSVKNNTGKPVSMEMLSSFTLGGLTPFIDGLAKDSMLIHQIRSTWANEGRLVSRPIEELQLEPSWKPSGANGIRFGQVGSMPNREYFPFIGIEDRITGVCWGAQLAIGSSWQLEAYRKDDALIISGGIADREKGHWVKCLESGETFETPKAIVSAANGSVDVLCQRIAGNIRNHLTIHPDEKDMPVIFNEFCTTWGNPEEKQIRRMADLTAENGVKYFVIDAGWFKKHTGKDDCWSIEHGDWTPSGELFPGGVHALVQYIHSKGMKAGIWFEFENCGRKSDAFAREELLYHRDGFPITAGHRRFFDMLSPEVERYLDERVIAFLKNNEFDYVKVDYNANLGIGPEGSESCGERLYESVLATQEYFKKMKRQIPGLIIENCSAGGHRLVEPFLHITDMSSYSDAHESMNIPLVAANMHRMIPVRQSQIWAVLHPEFPDDLIYYKMSSTLLGRMCLSGMLEGLTKAQWRIVEESINFYKKVSEIIDLGFSKIDCHAGESYKEPDGYQIVKREWKDELLIIIHTFSDCPESLEISLDDYEAAYEIEETLKHSRITVSREKGVLRLTNLKAFDGIGLQLRKEGA